MNSVQKNLSGTSKMQSFSAAEIFILRCSSFQNPAAYPQSTLDMDASFDYGGTDYRWSDQFADQFDHLMIAEIGQGSDDELPLYLALIIKDQKVAAITFYHPTAD